MIVTSLCVPAVLLLLLASSHSRVTTGHLHFVVAAHLPSSKPISKSISVSIFGGFIVIIPIPKASLSPHLHTHTHSFP